MTSEWPRKIYMWGQVYDQTDNEVAQELAEHYRVENRRLLEALHIFGQHDGGCDLWHGTGPCDCGYADALEGR